MRHNVMEEDKRRDLDVLEEWDKRSKDPQYKEECEAEEARRKNADHIMTIVLLIVSFGGIATYLHFVYVLPWVLGIGG